MQILSDENEVYVTIIVQSDGIYVWIWKYTWAIVHELPYVNMQAVHMNDEFERMSIVSDKNGMMYKS